MQTTTTDTTAPEYRHIRVKIPAHLYRRLKHVLADQGPELSLSDLVTSIIDRELSALGSNA